MNCLVKFRRTGNMMIVFKIIRVFENVAIVMRKQTVKRCFC